MNNQNAVYSRGITASAAGGAQSIKPEPTSSPAPWAGHKRSAKASSGEVNRTSLPRVAVRLSKNGAVVIIQDERGTPLLVNTNLIKHTLGIPYTKKDGTHKTAAQIRADQARADRAYRSAVESQV